MKKTADFLFQRVQLVYSVYVFGVHLSPLACYLIFKFNFFF